MLHKALVLESLDYLIYTKKTGTRKQLANKFSVSERTISRWIEFMKENGADIDYCRQRKSFYYLTPGKFIVVVKFKPDINNLQ